MERKTHLLGDINHPSEFGLCFQVGRPLIAQTPPAAAEKLGEGDFVVAGAKTEIEQQLSVP